MLPNRLVWPWIDVKSQKIDLLRGYPPLTGGNPAARFMVSFHEYAELEARGPLVGKILSVATRKKQN